MTATCATPVSDPDLLDLWTGELPGSRARIVEKHLLTCERCAKRAGEVQETADGIGSLVRSGRLAAVVLPTVVERLRREGRAIREYEAKAGSTVFCTISPDDDVVLTRLGVDLRDVDRLDLAIVTDGGLEHRLSDVPFDSGAAELVVLPSKDTLQADEAHVMRFRLLAVEPTGDRLLGEYTFNHRPWPGW